MNCNMKRLLFVILTLCVCIGLSAQAYWDAARANKLFTFGIRGGIAFSKQYNTQKYYTMDLNHRLGFHLGVEVDWNVCRSLSANLGLKIIQKGFKRDLSNERISLKVNNNATYLEIPVIASYRIALSDAAQFQLNVGPYFAYGLGGNYIVDFSDADDNVKDKTNSFDKYDGLRKFDFGLGYGCAITLSHLYFGVNYEHSLTKLGQDSRNGAQNSSIVISLGYNFN